MFVVEVLWSCVLAVCLFVVCLLFRASSFVLNVHLRVEEQRTYGPPMEVRLCVHMCLSLCVCVRACVRASVCVCASACVYIPMCHVFTHHTGPLPLPQVVFDAHPSPTPGVLREHISHLLGIPLERLRVAKYKYEAFDWIKIADPPTGGEEVRSDLPYASTVLI